jgi:ribosomal protein S18 acetylase RimI-like enzyme
MGPLVIRRLSAGDESLVYAAAHLFDRPPDAEGVRCLLADGRSYLLIASRDSAAVGFVRAYELPQLKGPDSIMLLYEIGVDPASRARGVGAALIDDLKRVCRARRIQKMFVITNETNVAAMALYRSTGADRPVGDDVVWVWRCGDADTPWPVTAAAGPRGL